MDRVTARPPDPASRPRARRPPGRRPGHAGPAERGPRLRGTPSAIPAAAASSHLHEVGFRLERIADPRTRPERTHAEPGQDRRKDEVHVPDDAGRAISQQAGRPSLEDLTPEDEVLIELDHVHAL